MSRPAAIAARAAKYVAMIDAVICPSEMTSMTMPVETMYAVSPRATPWSMMSAFSRGRYRDAIAEMNWNTSTPRSSHRYFAR